MEAWEKVDKKAVEEVQKVVEEVGASCCRREKWKSWASTRMSSGWV